MNRRIVMTGGGSAGHVTPNIALIPHLLASGWDIHYIGTFTGIERELIEPLDGITYHAIKTGKLRRYFDLKNVSDAFYTSVSVVKSARLMAKLKPDVVFSKGGYVAVPVLAGAWMMRVPVVAHESDITPGLANKLAMPFAKRICVTFPETLQHVHGKGVLTGTPVRAELFQGDAVRARNICGFTRKLPTLLAFGGSLGAVALNTALREALPLLLTRFNVVHLCGKGNYSKEHEATEGYKQFEYVSQEMADFYALADVVVSRAGANSLVELLAVKKPMLLIPLPLSASRGDQIENAKSYLERGIAHVLYQEDTTGDSLAFETFKLYDDRKKLKDTMNVSEGRDGTMAVLSEIEKAAKVLKG